MRSAARAAFVALGTLVCGFGCTGARGPSAAGGFGEPATLAPGAELGSLVGELVAMQGRVMDVRWRPRWVEFKLEGALAAGSDALVAPTTAVRVGIALVGPEAETRATAWAGREVRVVGRVDGLASPPALLLEDPNRVVLVESEALIVKATVIVAEPVVEVVEPSAVITEPVVEVVEPSAVITEPVEASIVAVEPRPAVVKAPAVARVAPPPVAVPVGSSPRLEPLPSPESATCRLARQSRDAVTTSAEPAVARLAACLAAKSPSCREQMEAARAPLAEIAAAEERVVWACPGEKP